MLYDDEWGQEFVWRQPHDPAEVAALRAAACEETLSGYGHDGDRHWTPDLVRDWWRERGRVRAWAYSAGWGAWVSSDRAEERSAAAAARRYAAYIDRELGAWLRGYAFRPAEGRAPARGERLPDL